MSSPSQPETGAGRVPARLFLVIGLAALIPVFAVAITLYSAFGGEQQRTFPIVEDYLLAPQTVPERVAVISAQVQSLQVSHGGIEIYDAEGQRYTISPDGTYLRRGGVGKAAGLPFAVDDVDFAKLPMILAAATERSGGNPNSATVEVIDGALTWRVVVWAEGGSAELRYGLDGELRVGVNAR